MFNFHISTLDKWGMVAIGVALIIALILDWFGKYELRKAHEYADRKDATK